MQSGIGQSIDATCFALEPTVDVPPENDCCPFNSGCLPDVPHARRTQPRQEQGAAKGILPIGCHQLFAAAAARVEITQTLVELAHQTVAPLCILARCVWHRVGEYINTSRPGNDQQSDTDASAQLDRFGWNTSFWTRYCNINLVRDQESVYRLVKQLQVQRRLHLHDNRCFVATNGDHIAGLDFCLHSEVLCLEKGLDRKVEFSFGHGFRLTYPTPKWTSLSPAVDGLRTLPCRLLHQQFYR